MPLKRLQEIEIIRRELSLPLTEPDAKRIFILNGMFGTGKTWLLNRLEEELINKKAVDSVMKFNDIGDIYFLPELTLKLVHHFLSSNDVSAVFKPSESEYNATRFIELINLIQSHEQSLYESYIRFNYLMSEADFILSESDENQSEQKELTNNSINEVIEAVGDKRVLFDTGRVTIESLIVDLMSLYYPAQRLESIRLGKEISEPKKIVLIFDNYEPVSYSINRWISGLLLPYCFENKFSDFIAFDTSFLPQDALISDYFDFRIIISGRENILEKDIYDYQRYSEKIRRMELKSLDSLEIREYLEKSNQNIVESESEILELTDGIPALLNFLIDSYRFGVGRCDTSSLLKMAANIILKYCNPAQKEWLICASFLDYFDEDALRCYPQICAHSERIFTYFKHSTELIKNEAMEDGKIILNPIIKKYLYKAAQSDSNHIANEYQRISDIYYSVNNLLDELDEKYRYTARNLAYLKYFNRDFNFEELLGIDNTTVWELVESYSDWFEMNDDKIFLNEYNAKIFSNYNKLYDGSKYMEKILNIQESWDNYSSDKDREIDDLRSKAEILKNQKKDLADGISVQKAEFEKVQSKFFDAENQIIDCNKNISMLTTGNRFLFAFKNIIGGGIIAAAGFFIKKVLRLFYSGDVSIIDDIQVVFYIIGLITIVVGVISFFRALFVRSKKMQKEDFKNNKLSLEEEKVKYQEQMQKIKERKAEFEKEIEEIELNITDIEAEIESLQSQIGDNYTVNP